ncbi:PREDICTED: uncharacterized protein LOC105368007 [Ceratosolen solmsi marchali]|uniref:Uncharacterized protein LOC105368007 n=1 Tax=Ceratosolen solmsi marchali TaxID=326594 RepID=A0AAJ7E290_9HYME|nr:PREDICTED: uncharacterized protein LOC105368007 [Ceratosolen solmsi marchali]
MSCNPRSMTSCRQGRMTFHSMQSDFGCDSGFEQPNHSVGRSLKSMVKSTIPKRGPPPALPKKIDYKKPQMTKAMIQRLKHTQRIQDELERKEQERTILPTMRKSRRIMTPTCGNPCTGREHRANTAENRGQSRLGRSKALSSCITNVSEPTMVSSSTCALSCAPTPTPSRKHLYQSSCASRGPKNPPSIPPRTRNLAKSMNADIVQAEPLQHGPVDNLIIPPGTINADRTTIVNILQPEGSASFVPSTPAQRQSSQTPIKSVQALNNSLDQQDAVESEVVNSKLQDLQQARRDFVLAVANVSGNAINLEDDFSNERISEITPPRLKTSDPSSPRLIQCPSLEDPYLRIKYERNHPVVEAAREYMRSRKAESTIDENFRPVSRQPVIEDIEADYLKGCNMISTVNDDDNDFYTASGQYTAMPNRAEVYNYNPLDIDQLEKFFDLENYPPPPVSPSPSRPTGPPPGRECIHPDLWELDDPWYKEPCMPDLIDWREQF